MSLLRAASLIAVLSLVSKGVGLIRDQVIAYYCGLNAITDAYQVASLIPIQFALIMLGGLNGPFHSAVVSTLTRHFQANDQRTYGRVLTTLIVLSVGCMGAISALLYIFAPQILSIWGNMPAETMELAVIQLKIMAPGFVLSGLIGILYGILSIRHSFMTPSLSPIMASLGIILGLLFFAGPTPESLARALAWGTLLGAVGQLLLQLIPLLGFFRTMPLGLDWRDPELRQLLELLLPAMLSSTIGQVNMFIIQFFATGLKEGSVGAFRFGNLLIQLPLGILLTALLVPLLPLLTSSAQLSDGFESLKERLNQGLRPILLLTVPITLLLVFFGYFAIVLLFQRGLFDAEASRLTYEVTVFLALSITVYAIRDLLIRVFYALGDSRTPFMTSFVTIVTMLLGSWLLAKPLGVGGVALASSLAAGLNFVVLAWFLHQRIGAFMQPESWRHFLKVSIAALPMAALSWQCLDVLPFVMQQSMFVGLFLAVLDAALVCLLYVLLLFLFEDREILLLGRRLLQSRLLRRFQR